MPDDQWLLAGQPREALEYCVPSNGAKVTLASAKQLVFHFCARLPSDRHANQFVITALASAACPDGR